MAIDKAIDLKAKICIRALKDRKMQIAVNSKHVVEVLAHREVYTFEDSLDRVGKKATVVAVSAEREGTTGLVAVCANIR